MSNGSFLYATVWLFFSLFFRAFFYCIGFIFLSLVAGCTLEKIDSVSHNYEFRLHDRARAFFFYTDSSEARREWMKCFLASMEGTHEGESKTKVVGHVNVEREAYSEDDSSGMLEMKQEQNKDRELKRKRK
jgi:hypothetical protein